VMSDRPMREAQATLPTSDRPLLHSAQGLEVGSTPDATLHLQAWKRTGERPSSGFLLDRLVRWAFVHSPVLTITWPS